MRETLIIAEAGVNHNGDINTAKSLIDAAKWCGADLIKFQTFSAANLVTKNASKANYQVLTTGDTETQYKMLAELELSDDMHHELINYCKTKDIGFFSSGFDIPSLDYLESLGAEQYKIPSGEITNLPYLRHLGNFGKPIILSTGMSTLKEIGEALRTLNKAGISKNLITILHCTSEYPAPINEVNLLAIKSLRKTILKTIKVN